MVECHSRQETGKKNIFGEPTYARKDKVDCTNDPDITNKPGSPKKIDCTIDYFKMFGISSESTEKDLKKAYREISLTVGADKNQNNLAADGKLFIEAKKIFDYILGVRGIKGSEEDGGAGGVEAVEGNKDFLPTYQACFYDPNKQGGFKNELLREVEAKGGIYSYLGKDPSSRTKKAPKSESKSKSSDAEKPYVYDPIKFILEQCTSPKQALNQLAKRKESQNKDLEAGKVINKVIDYDLAIDCVKDITDMGGKSLLDLCGDYVVYPNAGEF